METHIPNPVFINIEYFFFLVYRFFARVFHFIFGGNITDSNVGSSFFSGLKTFATFIVIILITIILYCLVRLYELKQEGKTKKVKSSGELQNTSNVSNGALEPDSSKQNEAWNSIRSKILSDNPSDWRLAIIEADIYLDKVLDQKGFYGDTLGDKLKQITPEKLPSIQIAWEAHKVRNRIAHDGVDYILTMPEARRTLSYFEITFSIEEMRKSFGIPNNFPYLIALLRILLRIYPCSILLGKAPSAIKKVADFA